jgi:DNA-directed RNA polymerase specialized sigma24 family protein
MNRDEKKIWDKALIYVDTSQTIKKMIGVHLPREVKEDFKSFLLLQLAELKPSKLIDSYENGYIDWLCLSIINAQSKSRSSRWNRLYEVIPQQNLQEDEELVGILPSRATSLVEIDTSSVYEDGDLDIADEFSDSLIDDEEAQENIKYHTKSQDLSRKINSMVNTFPFYSKELWRLRHAEGLTMREISRKTGINYNSVYYNLRKSERQVKNELQNEPLLNKFLKKLLNNERAGKDL